MRWKGRRQSQNVEDRRGRAPRRGAAVGGGAIVIALVAALLLGQDPLQILEQVATQQAQVSQTSAMQPRSAAENEAAQFVSVVLADTEDIWADLFRQAGGSYQAPRLVLFTGGTDTACGYGQAATGPFYCPPDQQVYLDLGFLGQLQRMGASGDFSVAYVIAHEVGHHVQTVTGTSNRVREAQRRAGQAGKNALQVRMELQADCFAGIWAHHADRQFNILERGDVEEALGAASAVGDDNLQRQAGRRVQPESFTHGSSEQRMQWFRRGLETGSVQSCDTFSG
jgi:predicted metalloprotease